jgi:hypothetical protein
MANDTVKLFNELAWGLASSEGPSPTAQAIVFDGPTVWASNDEVGVIGKNPYPELPTGMANGAKLLRFLGRAPGAGIATFEHTESSLLIRAGSAKLTLPWNDTVPSLPYSQPEEAEWIAAPRGFSEALASAALCCAEHLARPAMTCVRIGRTAAMGCDGFRLIRCKYGEKGLGKFKQDPLPLIPHNVALLLRSAKVEAIAVQPTVLWFRTKHTSIFARRMGAEYPAETEALLTSDPSAKQFTLSFGEKLVSMLERTDSFAEEAQGRRPMELAVSKGKLRCKTKDAEGAKYEEWQKADGIPEFAISIDARHLLDLAKQGKQGAKVSCELGSDKLWIRTEDWEYVCLLLPL